MPVCRSLSTLRLIVLLGIALTTPPLLALPQDFSASYVARARGLTLGRAELELRRNGNDYDYRSHMRATGPLSLIYRNRIKERSSGELRRSGIVPHRYDYIRTGRGGREDSVRFDPAREQAVVTFRGERERIAVPTGALDPLSLHLALMRDVRAGNRQMRYLLVEPRRRMAYRLEVVGQERVALQSGTYDAIRVEVVGELRVRDGSEFDLASAEIPATEANEATTFWFAPELEYLPVRIRHQDPDDGTLELELERVASLRSE